MSTTAVEPFGSFMPECYQFFNAFKSDPVAKISLHLTAATQVVPAKDRCSYA
jgi:hypothetical protein